MSKRTGAQYYKNQYFAVYFNDKDREIIEKAKKLAEKYGYTLSRFGKVAVKEKVQREEELAKKLELLERMEERERIMMMAEGAASK